MKNLLKDQVAVVTGGNGGIGKAIGLKFAQEGATVILLGTNVTKGESAVKDISELVEEAKVSFLSVDVSHTQAVEEAIQAILKKEKKIDILVNNAGITCDRLLMQMKEDEWDKVISVNLKSCYNLCHAVMRSMIKMRQGKIINMSSVVGLMGNPGQTNYAASKAGMIGFTKALAKEVASRNVYVNCVAPGYIDTQMTENLSSTNKEEFLKQIPLGRMGVSEEIANVVWFLASPLSSYMTGQVITVDGGLDI